MDDVSKPKLPNFCTMELPTLCISCDRKDGICSHKSPQKNTLCAPRISGTTRINEAQISANSESMFLQTQTFLLRHITFWIHVVAYTLTETCKQGKNTAVSHLDHCFQHFLRSAADVRYLILVSVPENPTCDQWIVRLWCHCNFNN